MQPQSVTGSHGIHWPLVDVLELFHPAKSRDEFTGRPVSQFRHCPHYESESASILKRVVDFALRLVHQEVIHEVAEAPSSAEVGHVGEIVHGLGEKGAVAQWKTETEGKNKGLESDIVQYCTVQYNLYLRWALSNHVPYTLHNAAYLASYLIMLLQSILWSNEAPLWATKRPLHVKCLRMLSQPKMNCRKWIKLQIGIRHFEIFFIHSAIQFYNQLLWLYAYHSLVYILDCSVVDSQIDALGIYSYMYMVSLFRPSF